MPFSFHDEEHVRRIVREEVKDQLTEFRSGVYDKLDKIIGIMQKSDQEVDLLAEHSKEHNDKIESVESIVEDHEERLTQIESSPVFAKA